MGVNESRGRFLVELIDRYEEHDSKILEIGCKSGKNLQPLYEAGYENLTGLEVDGRRLDRLERLFPGLSSRVEVLEGPVLEVISRLADSSFDMVFSVGYFEEDEDRENLFDEMARVARQRILIIEDERDIPGRAPRNFRSVFESRGFEQVEEIDVSIEPDIRSVFFGRVFERR